MSDKKYNIVENITNDAPHGELQWYTLSFLSPYKIPASFALNFKAVKIYCAYTSFELANMDAKRIKEQNKNNDIYVAQMGKLYGWDNFTQSENMQYDDAKLDEMNKVNREQTDKARMLNEYTENEVKARLDRKFNDSSVKERLRKQIHDKGKLSRQEEELISMNEQSQQNELNSRLQKNKQRTIEEVIDEKFTAIKENLLENNADALTLIEPSISKIKDHVRNQALKKLSGDSSNSLINVDAEIIKLLGEGYLDDVIDTAVSSVSENIAMSVEQVQSKIDEAWETDYLTEEPPNALKYGCLTIFSPVHIKNLKDVCFKVRGVYETQTELQKRYTKLKKQYPHDRIYTFEIGKWSAFSEDDKMPITEILKQANYTMKCYNEYRKEENANFEERRKKANENSLLTAELNKQTETVVVDEAVQSSNSETQFIPASAEDKTAIDAIKALLENN